MKKWMVYAGVSLWLFVGVRGIAGSIKGGSTVLAAFTDNVSTRRDYRSMEVLVEAEGRYPVYDLTREEIEALSKDLAMTIGVSTPEEVEIRLSTKTEKDVFGDTIKVLYVHLISEASADYYEKFREAFDYYHIEGEVYLNLCGISSGEMSLKEKDELTLEILDELSANVVTGVRDSELYTIYAYSKSAGEGIKVGEDIININVTISYDKSEDVSQIYISTPINSLEY